MPTVNIFHSCNSLDELKNLTPKLKGYVANKLSGSDIQLNSDEVSVRFIKAEGEGMLAPVEIEATAAAFKERVDKQDQICLDIQKFILENTGFKDVKVWLILAELGHSWK